ncbi:MAG TPA: TA system VapC family ribonuclease toxin [Longimicrobiaceae bacterium]|nr:TA system VapC family ribonuclease toxin [Longimicrobiaceae bacterium]
MVAVDTNVLVYAHRRESRVHAVALEVMRDLAEGGDPWGVPWPCVYEFFSVVTNPRIWKEAASTPEEAWVQLEAWLGSPTVRLLGETDGFMAVLSRLARRARVRGPIIHDARIAALCLAHGVERLLTRDRDFSLFPELVHEDPFAR